MKRTPSFTFPKSSGFKKFLHLYSRFQEGYLIEQIVYYLSTWYEKQVHALEIDLTCNGTISPERLGATSEGSLFRFPEKRSSLIGPGALGLAPGGCSCTWFATISSSRLGASDGEGCVQVLRILGATLLPISNISVLCVHVLQQWTPSYQGFQVFSTVHHCRMCLHIPGIITDLHWRCVEELTKVGIFEVWVLCFVSAPLAHTDFTLQLHDNNSNTRDTSQQDT